MIRFDQERFDVNIPMNPMTLLDGSIIRYAVKIQRKGILTTNFTVRAFYIP